MVQSRTQRKACDVCYRKRIRCDGQKPRCSHCELYSTECTFQAPSRKARAHTTRQEPANVDRDALQARVEHLELSLGRAQQTIHNLERTRTPRRWTEPYIPDLLTFSGFPELHLVGFSQTSLRAATLELPSRLEVTSAVENYLKTMNSILPLFHPEKLRRRVHDWFENRISHRNGTTWAAINIVMALSHRCTPADETTPDRNVTHFVKNAQSVLHEVLMGEPDLLNVQVLVGMVMLFQATFDLKPAAMLMALALRLAHELGLHSRGHGGAYVDSTERTERDRVFWIAYILDCDISMRTRQPPVQRHVDIDIDWPLVIPADAAGLISGVGHTATFNFFLARVKLARVQADVYETMFSTRSKSLSSYELLQDVSRVRFMLDDWLSAIPPSFLPDAVVHTAEPDVRRAFAVLYATHLACRIWVCKAHIMESAWLQHLQEFGQVSAQGAAGVPIPPLPQGWASLVSCSREYMRLFMSVEQKDPAFTWMTACTYISGSVCLMANTMFDPRHDSAEADRYLANVCFSFLEEILDQVPTEPLQRTRNACEELLRYTHAALS